MFFLIYIKKKIPYTSRLRLWKMNECANLVGAYYTLVYVRGTELTITLAPGQPYMKIQDIN